MVRIDPNYVAVANGMLKGEVVGPQPAVKTEQFSISNALSALNSLRKGITSQARDAARRGNADKLRELLPHVPDVNKRSKDDLGYAIAHAAAQSANPDVMDALIQHGGVDLNARANVDPQPTPLHIASVLGNVPVAEKLVAAGADPLLKTVSLERSTKNVALHALGDITPPLTEECVFMLREFKAWQRGKRPQPPTVATLPGLPTFDEVAALNDPPSYEANISDRTDLPPSYDAIRGPRGSP